jgi:type I restriction enzyme, S subunit
VNQITPPEHEFTTLGEVVGRTGGAIQTGPFGSQLHASDYTVTGTPLIMPVNLGDNEIREAGIARVGSKDARRLRRHALREGDVIFSRRGDVGRRSLVRAEQSGWLCGTGCLAARFGSDRSAVNTAYVAQYLGSKPAQAWLQDNAVGGTLPNLNTSILAALPIRLPSRAEQDAIVTALDDAQVTVVGIERLIAKKQPIKQGMMQQLLTGRIRMPGFSSTWTEAPLGQIARIKTGSRNNQDKNAGGRYPFFVRSATVERIDSYSYDCEAILVPGEGGIGSIFHYVNGKFEVHQRVYKISEFASNVSGRYVYYFMRQFFGPHAMENSVKATVDSLRLPTFRGFEVRLPSREEQRAIVNVLDDAELELVTLSERLAKARAIKTGMMQQLLTGRTRLPVEAAS